MAAVTMGVARRAAARWVVRHASKEAGFQGAFFSGSTTTLSDDAALPATTDLDVIVVVRQDTAPDRLGRFLYQDVLLDVRYLPFKRLATADAVLNSHRLAPNFRGNTVIMDPSGHLGRLWEFVAERYRDRVWVRGRCQDARTEIENGLRDLNRSAPLPNQVEEWLSATGLTARLLLVAALRHPSARRVYVAARKVLDDYGHKDVYPELLDLLGFVHLADRRVRLHLQALEKTFDAAIAASRSPYFLGAKIAPAARPVLIDGAHTLIDRGFHREAMFEILMGLAQCQIALTADAPREVRRTFAPPFEAALGDLNITGTEDVARRAADALHYLPTLWGTAEKILAANTRIR